MPAGEPERTGSFTEQAKRLSQLSAAKKNDWNAKDAENRFFDADLPAKLGSSPATDRKSARHLASEQTESDTGEVVL